MITEKGLYKLMYSSHVKDKPVAKAFQEWAFTVLREVRINGKYEMQKQVDTLKDAHEQQPVKVREDAEHAEMMQREKTLLEDFDMKKVVYLGLLVGRRCAKFGWSDDLKTRTATHKRQIGDCFVLVEVVACSFNRELEAKMKESTGGP